MCDSPVSIPTKEPDRNGIKGRRYYREVPCGRCDACLKMQVMLWSARLELTSRKYKASYLVTFTINDTWYLILHNSKLYRYYLQTMFKRIRKKYDIKYYLVGENGEQTNRLHSHAILFINEEDPVKVYNLVNSAYQNNLCRKKLPITEKKCQQCKTHECLNQVGFIEIGESTYGGYVYVTGYLKKNPLFRLISKGIGKLNMTDTIEYIKKNEYVHRYYKNRLKENMVKEDYDQFIQEVTLPRSIRAYEKYKHERDGYKAREGRYKHNKDLKNKLKK